MISVQWKILILQIFCTAMPTKWGKSGDALHLASITAGAHLPVVASRAYVLDPDQFQLCPTMEMRRIVNRLRFSNRSVKEPKNIDCTTENSFSKWVGWWV